MGLEWVTGSPGFSRPAELCTTVLPPQLTGTGLRPSLITRMCFSVMVFVLPVARPFCLASRTVPPLPLFLCSWLTVQFIFPDCLSDVSMGVPANNTSLNIKACFHVLKWLSFIFFLFIDLRGRERRREEGRIEREEHQFVVPLIYIFIVWFLHVPWLGIQPATLAYWDNALTHWATWPRQFCNNFPPELSCYSSCALV